MNIFMKLYWKNCTKFRNTLSSSIFACLCFQGKLFMHVHIEQNHCSKHYCSGGYEHNCYSKKLSLQFLNMVR